MGNYKGGCMFFEQVGHKIKDAFSLLNELIQNNKEEINNLGKIVKNFEKLQKNPKNKVLFLDVFSDLTEGVETFNAKINDIVLAIRNHEQGYQIEDLALELESMTLPDLATCLQEDRLFRSDVKVFQKLLSEKYAHKCIDKIYDVCISGLNYDVAKVLSA